MIIGTIGVILMKTSTITTGKLISICRELKVKIEFLQRWTKLSKKDPMRTLVMILLTDKRTLMMMKKLMSLIPTTVSISKKKNNNWICNIRKVKYTIICEINS